MNYMHYHTFWLYLLLLTPVHYSNVMTNKNLYQFAVFVLSKLNIILGEYFVHALPSSKQQISSDIPKPGSLYIPWTIFSSKWTSASG